MVTKVEWAKPYCNVTLRVAGKDIMFQVPQEESTAWYVGQEVTLTVSATSRRQARRLAVREAERAAHEQVSPKAEAEPAYPPCYPIPE